MFDTLASLFHASDFLPHGHCFLWLPAMVWLHVVSDAVVGVSYFSIPLAIYYFARRRQDLPFRYIFMLSSLFIVLCGSTHFFSIWVLWNPDYGPEGIVKALTAIASALTTVIIWKIMPIALTLPSPAQLEKMNQQLKETNVRIEQEVAKRTDELQDANRRLLDSERTLQQAQKMDAIGTLTGGMAHDFNNLLGIMIGNLDLLLQRLKDSSETKELAQSTLDAALRGADLTSRLLAFARQQPLQPQRIGVNALVEGIMNLLRRMLGEDIQVLLELDADAWAIVADPAQMEATLTNLVTNARDAMPRGGKLTILTGNRRVAAEQYPDIAPGDYTVIEVSDSGAGMPAAIISRIFEPFFTTKKRGKGTGLGLAMVFGFIKQSGGYINVQSEMGRGTVFRLYLPRALQDTVPTMQIPTVEPTNSGHETVLVVEDNNAVRVIVVRQLQELGYHVLEVESAAEVLELLATGVKVDLLFTDIVMPGEPNGLELARIVVGRWPTIKIILTSGFPEANLNGRGDPITSMRLLSKPYRKQDLARVLRDVLEST